MSKVCLAIPGEIIDIIKHQAKINIMGAEIIVNIQLIENPKVGEYVIVHAGCAIEKINRDYFNDLNNIFESIINEDEEING